MAKWSGGRYIRTNRPSKCRACCFSRGPYFGVGRGVFGFCRGYTSFRQTDSLLLAKLMGATGSRCSTKSLNPLTPSPPLSDPKIAVQVVGAAGRASAQIQKVHPRPSRLGSGSIMSGGGVHERECMSPPFVRSSCCCCCPGCAAPSSSRRGVDPLASSACLSVPAPSVGGISPWMRVVLYPYPERPMVS